MYSKTPTAQTIDVSSLKNCPVFTEETVKHLILGYLGKLKIMKQQ